MKHLYIIFMLLIGIIACNSEATDATKELAEEHQEEKDTLSSEEFTSVSETFKGIICCSCGI